MDLNIPGHGATFRIHLPGIETIAEQEFAAKTIPAPGHETGTILLVEDKDALVTIVRSVQHGQKN